MTGVRRLATRSRQNTRHLPSAILRFDSRDVRPLPPLHVPNGPTDTYSHLPGSRASIPVHRAPAYPARSLRSFPGGARWGPTFCAARRPRGRGPPRGLPGPSGNPSQRPNGPSGSSLDTFPALMTPLTAPFRHPMPTWKDPCPGGSCSRQVEAPAPTKRHGDCGCRRG
jgi:hypothetical protein